MQQISLVRTSDVDTILSFLQGRYPLLSETEILKMALSKQYQQELQEGTLFKDPTQNFTQEEWKKKFLVFKKIRDNITEEDEAQLDEAITKAVKEVRAEKSIQYD